MSDNSANQRRHPRHENTENILKMQSKLVHLLINISQRSEITDEDKKSIHSLQKELDDNLKDFVERK